MSYDSNDQGAFAAIHTVYSKEERYLLRALQSCLFIAFNGPFPIVSVKMLLVTSVSRVSSIRELSIVKRVVLVMHK